MNDFVPSNATDSISEPTPRTAAIAMLHLASAQTHLLELYAADAAPDGYAKKALDLVQQAGDLLEAAPTIDEH